MDDMTNPPTSGEMIPADELDSKAEGATESVNFDDFPETAGQEAAQHNRRSTDTKTGSLDAVLDVPVKVQAVLGRARMPIAELVTMRPGFVVELDRRVGEPIDLLVNNRLIARGEIVMIDGSLGVTLTEIVKQDT
jgi:flagellar motor switch protein FliN